MVKPGLEKEELKRLEEPKHPDPRLGTLKNRSLNLSRDRGLNQCPRQGPLKSLDPGLPGCDPDILLDEDVVDWPGGGVTALIYQP